MVYYSHVHTHVWGYDYTCTCVYVVCTLVAYEWFILGESQMTKTAAGMIITTCAQKYE